MKRLFALFLCIVLCLSLIPAAAAADKPTISTQPKSVTAAADSTAKFTVSASGASSYQWYWRSSASESWSASSASSAKTATLSLKAESYRNGYQYRCKVSNAAGYVYTNAVTLTVVSKPIITAQPQSVTAAAGAAAKFTVKASGAASYLWYWRTGASGDWKASTASSAKSATLSITAETYRNGYQYRCKVSNSAGYVYTAAATLTVTGKPTVSAQPKSVSAAAGATATFTVSASGAASYQWYWRTGASGEWKASTASSAKSATLSVTAETYRSGYQYRCKVSNAAGYVYSNAATLTVLSKPVIKTQPLSLIASKDAEVSFTVVASDARSYQWYWRTGASGEWKASTAATAKTPTLAVTAETYRSGYQYRCKVTNAAGDVYTNAAKLTVNPVKCGEKLDWVLDSAGTMRITGTGYTHLFNPYGEYEEDWENPPWYDVRDTIKTVIISDGVLNVSEYLFADCGNLTSLTLADSIQEIGADAFDGCVKLKSVTIPAGITDTENLSYNAFSGCTSLAAYKLSAAGSPAFSVKDGVLFSKDMTVLLRCPQAKSGSYTVPSGVTTIGYSAFSGAEKLTSLTIADSVTTVRSYAVNGCTALKTLHIGSGVQNDVNNYVVSGCTALTAFTVSAGSEKYSAKDGVLMSKSGKTIYLYPQGKTGNYTIPSGVTTIKEEAFRNCTELTGVIVPDSVKTIGNSVFGGCVNLSNVQLGKSVERVGYETFRGCKALIFIRIPGSLKDVSYGMFAECSSLETVVFEPGVQRIFDSAFDECTALKSIEFPESMTWIMANAFEDCDHLQSVTIPVSMKTIDSCAFVYCGALTDVYYRGTQAQWSAINIEENGNETLLNAVMHYNA